MYLDEPLTSLKGIGEKTAEKFHRIGIFTIGDLVGFYPRTYDSFQPPVDMKEAADGRIEAVCGFIAKPLSLRRVRNMQIITGTIITDYGEVPVTWFNMPYLKNNVTPGMRYVFRGYVKQKGRRLTLVQPKLYDPQEYEALSKQLQPVYPLTQGLTESTLRKAITQALGSADFSADYMPERIRKEYELAQYSFALRQIHFPEDMHHLKTARKRLVFDEFLLFILALKRLKDEASAREGALALTCFDSAGKILGSLPYQLTRAQERVWEDVKRDLSSGKAMVRLIQGDVGSGKTIIAFLALSAVCDAKAQGALMVPTEVLARQHYDAFVKLTEQCGLPIKAVLLTGSMGAAQKREACRQIKSGEAGVIIGTHALIQEKVEYRHLALVVTDEQHRFGVRQREALFSKGETPHTLVMSATPIPRTLAVILYSDLDVSVIDQMPQGRKSVKNCVVDSSWRPKAWQFIEREVKGGHQAYVICAMVEDSEQIEAENVLDYTKALCEKLDPSIKVEYLHGRMKAKEKNEIMERFVSGETKVLVSTTVIEVGVNVPNATVMMIEDAQRFGLAQLHQLRGRVGRGSDQAYCIMIDTGDSEETDRRLKIMNESNDGFVIAQKDLELRGPGDLFGIRQSGLIDFKIADVFGDASIMQSASRAAKGIIDDDHDLQKGENALLREKLLSYMRKELVNVNI